MAALPANTLIAAAMGLGYDNLSTRAIQECLLWAVGENGGGGGGGGSGSVVQGNGAPAAPPADPLAPAIYTDFVTTFVYSWNVVTQTWVISSTSGGNALSQGLGDPVADPTDPTVPALYVDVSPGSYVIWTWNVGDQTWH